MKPIQVIARRPLSLALLLFAGLMLAAAGAQADARHYGKWKSVKVKLHELKAKNFRHYRHHKSRLSGLEDRVSALEENGGADVSALEARISELEAEIVAMYAITDNVAALQTDVDILAGVNDQLTKLAADVAALQSDLSSVSGDVSALTARVGDVESALAGLVSQTQTNFDALAQRVTDLESAGGAGGGGGAGGPTSIDVDCALGDSINTALADGDPARPITITVIGTCTEDVVVHRDDVTIQGASPGAGEIFGGILVDGSGRVVIRHLILQSLEVSNTSDLSIDPGSTSFNGPVSVTNNSNADLGGSALFGGLSVSGHSRARLGFATVFSGVSLSEASMLKSEGASVSGGITCSNSLNLVVDNNGTLVGSIDSSCTVE